jgi:hypothetical protein
MADGISSLNTISWGTSTGGSAVSAESTLSLGVDRVDTRIPPDTSHLWGAALNNAKNLLLAMSATFKGGTRLGVATQSASPFGASEQGLWCDTSGNPKWSYGGVANTLLSVAMSSKGDLITYTGSAVAVLPVGTNNFVLTADSTQPNGIKWAAGGGGSTTLAAAYAAGASTTDSIFSLDATRGKFLIKDNAAPIGTLFEIQSSGGTSKFLFDASNLTFGINRGIATVAGIGAFDFSNATGAFSTSSGTNTLNGNVSLASGKTFVYAGGASTFDASLSSGVFKTTTGAHTFGSASWAVPANLVVTGASSSTNTTGIALAPNVADGASSVALDLNTGAALANSTSKFLRIRNNSTEVGSIRLSQFAAGGIRIVGDSAAFMELSLNGASALGYNSNFISVGTSAISVNGANLLSDTATTLGSAATPWPSVFASKNITTPQSNTMTGTVTITPSSSFVKQTYTSATNVTALTISAGTDGQELIVELIQPGAGTAATMVTTWANVSFAGGVGAFTATLGKRDVYTFQYDGTTSKWYERSRALNLTN